MKRMQKWISLLVTGAMLVSLLPAALAADFSGGGRAVVDIYHLDATTSAVVGNQDIYSIRNAAECPALDGDWADTYARNIDGYTYVGSSLDDGSLDVSAGGSYQVELYYADTSSVYKPANWNDPVLDEIMTVEGKAVSITLKDGQTLDLSSAGSGPSGYTVTVYVQGSATLIGKGNTGLRRILVSLGDGAELTVRQLSLFLDPANSAVSVQEGASATLILDGENQINAFTRSISVADGSRLAIRQVNGGWLNALDGAGAIEGGGTVYAEDVRLTIGNITADGAYVNCGLMVSGGISGQVSLTGSTVDISGGAPALGGEITIDNSAVTARAANNATAVTGTVNLNSGSLTAGTFSGNDNYPHHAVENAVIHLGQDAVLNVFSNYKVSAIDTETVIVTGGEILQGRLASSQQIQDFRVNDGRVVSPRESGDRSFAVNVEPSVDGTYSVTHRYGLSYAALPLEGGGYTGELTLDGENKDLVWKAASGDEIEHFYLDGGSITVAPGMDGTVLVQYGGAEFSVPANKALSVKQEDSGVVSPSHISVESGVSGLTLVLDSVNMGTNTAWENLITVKADSDVTILLEGENTLTASGSCIALENGASLVLDGDSLNATTTGDLAGAIQVVPGAELTIAGGTINAAVKSDAAGAAIGGRGATGGGTANWADCGTILITGDAVVNAEGGNDGAAIGGGQYGSGGDITITGNASVTAIAGAHAAAIGGGGQSSDRGHDLAAGQITISGNADVYAVGGAGAAAIGRGRFASAELSEGDITVTTGGSVTAFADGAYFAIDVPEAGDSGDTSILNARFADGELSYLPQAGNPIVVCAVDGDAARSLTLKHIGSNNPIRAFACTVPAGTYMVRNGAQGKELQHTEYTLLDGDRDFLFAVAGDAMTTRDDLRFKTFTITATAGRGGSISPAGATTVAPLGGQSYTITPDDHYLVDTVTVNGDAVEATGSYTFAGVTADQEIHVSFKPVAQYVVSVNYYLLSADADHVYTDADKVLDSFLAATGYAGDTYAVDAAVTSGQAVEGYTFAQLSGDPATGVLDGDKAINVYFTKNPAAQYSVRVNYYLLSEDADHVYTDADKVLDSVTAVTGLAGETYAVDAALTSGQAVEGHTFARLSGDPATGVLDGDKTINVYFTKNAGTEPENPGGGDDDDRPVRPDRPDPTPAPTPDEEITDNETPLNPGPEVQDIPDGETPLSPAPEGGEEMVVEEGEVPLGNLPQTGAVAAPVNPALTLGLAALALSLAAAGLSLRKKETED